MDNTMLAAVTPRDAFACAKASPWKMKAKSA
jgi:hypothetical protein